MSRPRKDQEIGQHPEESLGARLAEARRNKKLRLMDVADLAGMKANQISRYENGKTPGVAQLRRLADALEVSPSWLIYGTEEPFRRDDLVERLASMEQDAAVTVLSLAITTLDRDDRRAVATLVLHLTRLQHGDEHTDFLFHVSEIVGEHVQDSGALASVLEAAGEDLEARAAEVGEGGGKPSGG